VIDELRSIDLVDPVGIIATLTVEILPATTGVSADIKNIIAITAQKVITPITASDYVIAIGAGVNSKLDTVVPSANSYSSIYCPSWTTRSSPDVVPSFQARNNVLP